MVHLGDDTRLEIVVRRGISDLAGDGYRQPAGRPVLGGARPLEQADGGHDVDGVGGDARSNRRINAHVDSDRRAPDSLGPHR